ncbi:hypothetical protein [Sphingobacterium siyangense]|uniref:hypothetical protein n=1 Tax=Sphingobacterium siyangense TaxID=459529 RepID=UPI0011A829DB|nr:hypothetical protein [Sphingobacterium siyangense]
MKKRIPLYQMDIPGVMLIGTTMMLINYIVVYGKVEDWFSSNKIILASWVAVLTFLLFIKRELHVKRPAFNLNLLKKKNLPIGLLYFFLMGVFIPSTFQSSFTGGVLGYESITSADLNLYLIPGVIIGGIISYIWFYKNFSGHILMTFGFALLVAYHIFMYYGFSSDFTKEDFLIPLIFKGAGQAILFTSIGWYTTSNFPFPLVLKAVAMVILFRSFLSGAVFSGIYGYLLYAGKIKHLERLVYDTGNPTLVEGQTMQQLQKSLQIQSTLTASKELTGYIIIFGIVLISILLLVYTYKRVQSMLE